MADPDRKPGPILRLMGPATAAAAEAESRAWLIHCPNCGFTRSVWDAGGTRYKAAGTARWRMRCPKCGEMGWHRVEKGPDFPTTSGPILPLVLFILALVLLILIATAAVLLSVFWFVGIL